MISAQIDATESLPQEEVQSSDLNSASAATGAKHSISSTISPPDTPDTRSSPTTPSLKKLRMDTSDNTSLNNVFVLNNIQARLSVVASSSQNVNVSAKYDRQIRIWGDHGQTALANGCVYVIGHSMTASEVAKNLSLAGVGSFVFVDIGLIVTHEQVKRQSIPPLRSFENKSFCDAIAQWTKLFNPSATICCLQLKNMGDLATFIHDLEHSEGDMRRYKPSCILVFNPNPEIELNKLVESLLPIPVISCSTIGLMSYARLCLPPVYPVTEAHVEYAVDDLRLLEPFPGLIALYDLLNFDELTAHDRRAVPWPLIVLHYLRKLFPTNNGSSLSHADRELLKKHIKEVSIQDAKKSEQNEENENFQQALKGLNAALTSPPGIPDEIAELLADENVDNSTDSFWLMCAGLRKFLDSRSNMKYPLPLRGSIPDISASTVRFVSLQEAYRQQADMDAAAVHNHVLTIAQNRKVDPEKMPTFTDVQIFCRNAAFLKVLRGVSLVREDLNSIREWQSYELYVAMRAFDDFCSYHSRLPCVDDLPELSGIANRMAPGVDNFSAILSELIACSQSPEVCSPVMGGIISHEAVKIVTGQFVPVNNVLIFDGRTKSISSDCLGSR